MSDRPDLELAPPTSPGGSRLIVDPTTSPTPRSAPLRFAAAGSLPAGLTSKVATVGPILGPDGVTPARGTATLTLPVNLRHMPTGARVMSGRLTAPLDAEGSASFALIPNDADGLDRADWTYRLELSVTGAITQPDPLEFRLLADGPDVVDLDALASTDPSAGVVAVAQAVTADELDDALAAHLPRTCRVWSYRPPEAANNAVPQLPLNSIDTNDDGAIFAPDLAAGTLTVRVPGLYQLAARVWFLPASLGSRSAILRVNGNGVDEFSMPSDREMRVGPSLVMRLAAGDVLSLAVYVTTATTVPIGGASAKDTWLAATYLGA